MRKSVFGLALATLMASAPLTCLGAQMAPDTVALAVKDEVGGKLKGVYAARGFWPIWVREGALTPAAKGLIGYLETAEVDGLEPADYDLRAVRASMEAAQGSDPKALARAEVRLSQAYARYLRDLRRPRGDRSMRYLDDELAPQRLSEADALRTIGVARDADAFVADMGWMNPAYASLRRAVAERRTRWNDLPHSLVPEGPALKLGAKGARVQALRERLGFDSPGKFDDKTASALRQFQLAHGLKPDGVPGTTTIAALNRGRGWYDRKLAVNLERARLLPGPGVRHIIVDTAAQQLVYFQDGAEAGRMRVVVGKPDQATPMLAGLVRYAILNPYWNVPDDLSYNRVVQRVMGGASLRSLGFEAVSSWEAGARSVAPEAVDWDAVAAGATPIRFRQLPGPKNAMGRVKFMFPNDLGIYLHDTNEPELMSRSARAFSSGCVRLEDAQRLGEWLFGRPLLAETGLPEQQVALPAPVPVFLTYLTVRATGDAVAYLDDIYDRDDIDPREFASR